MNQRIRVWESETVGRGSLTILVETVFALNNNHFLVSKKINKIGATA